MTVLLWRERYQRAGLAGLADEACPGRPRLYGRDERDRVIALTLEPPSDGTTHWSARRLADRVAMSETTVWRIWQTVGLKPHRPETFKFSTDPELHVVLDNESSHKTPDVRAWLERHPRITFHFTPTSASWMNQIETWFGILSRAPIRRGSFGSVKELIAGIELFAATWNAGASPFAWVKTADEILAKAVRKRPAISESRH